MLRVYFELNGEGVSHCRWYCLSAFCMMGTWEDLLEIIVRFSYGVLTFYISQHAGNDNVGLGMSLNASAFKGALNGNRFELQNAPRGNHL